MNILGLVCHNILSEGFTAQNLWMEMLAKLHMDVLSMGYEICQSLADDLCHVLSLSIRFSLVMSVIWLSPVP